MHKETADKAPGKMRVAGFLFLLCIALVLPAARAEVYKPEVTGIRNFSELRESTGFAGPRVGFGGATAPPALALLQQKGYATVINLRLADEDGVNLEESMASAKTAGLNYIHLPFDPENLRPGLVDEFLALVAVQENHPVYIHCNSATRVGALWMIGRTTRDNWGIDAARREIQLIADAPEDSIAFAMSYLHELKSE